jgi:ABC-2 type transport system permease protein
MNGIRLYLRYASVSVRGQMQYRASFLMQALAQFAVTGFEFLAVWALFGVFGSIQGWSFAEVAVFYGTVGTSFALCDAVTRGFDVAPRLIRQGDLDRVLLRPRSTLLQLFGYELTIRRLGRLSQGALVLAVGLASLGVHLTPARIAVLAWAIAGSACLFVGILILQATLAFWTTETLELVNTLTYGGMETAQYPMAIYEPWFRRFFTFVVPLACVVYFPVLLVLGRADPLGTSAPFQAASPLAGVLFLVVAAAVWRVGVRAYRSTGS